MPLRSTPPHPNQILRQIMAQALRPCVARRSCAPRHLTWDPAAGHAPRGFCGTIGHLEEVQLVLVCAEPANPRAGESHVADGTVEGMVDSAHRFAWAAFEEPLTPVHRNIRRILDLCWPGLSFEQQMRRTWLTESVLCSAPIPRGRMNPQMVSTCAQHLLRVQLQALAKPGLVIGALGGKAQERLQQIGRNDFAACVTAAPPGANRPEALASWRNLAARVHQAG